MIEFIWNHNWIVCKCSSFKAFDLLAGFDHYLMKVGSFFLFSLYSVNDTKSSASHMSSYNAKVTDSAYSTGIGSSRMSNSIPSSVPASSMDQSVRAAYGHGQNVPSQKVRWLLSLNTHCLGTGREKVGGRSRGGGGLEKMGGQGGSQKSD